MKILKKTLLLLIIIIIMLLVIIFSAIGIVQMKTNRINNDYSSFFTDEKYSQAVFIHNIDVMEQTVTCGYAVIEMFSKWTDGNVTESNINEKNSKITTVTGKGFVKEMNKQVPEYKTTMHAYLKNTELLDKVYCSLSNGIPVPFQWAAKYGDDWTLHYSLVIGIDVATDNITVSNPYGYIENITIKEFLDRTSYQAYEKMPFFLKLGFAFGIFEKNTVYIAEVNNT